MFFCSTFVRNKALKYKKNLLWRQLFGRGSATSWKIKATSWKATATFWKEFDEPQPLG
jgi:hypothetical protein